MRTRISSILNNPQNNHILSALPLQDYQNLEEYLQPVELSLNEILSQPNQNHKTLYFPTQGIVSLMSVMANNSTTEIALIGKEGMVGTLPFLGEGVSNSQSIVKAQGWAMQIEAKALQEQCDRSNTLQKLLLRYALKLFNQVSQSAACNNHHTVKQRTARWLLMFDDRSDRETLLMTQQLLSQMLGVRRTGITEVAKELQRQKIIDYHRGKIKIINRKALEAVACECYQVLKDWSFC